ncbi:26482_t:CDS:2 [Gigaspora margarita]|uniref:26482_t:CDS:1 n=1 Tax=Gigaspora margarita TaxID=4874 RepID=A0ABN7UN07_GIGMA|nr:26482_t:CDS:2 [Gigaspora margarita]
MLSSYLNVHEHDTINILSPSYSNIYQHGFMNALSSPYPNDYDLAGSSQNVYNFDLLGSSLQLNNDVLIKSDVETRSVFVSSLLDDIPQNCIQEVWKITRHRKQQLDPQYIIILNDTNNIDEFVNKMIHFIENTKKNMHNQNENINPMDVGDPLMVRHKGRQPKRYKSRGELPKKKAAKIESSNVESKKREKYCQKCKGTGHYAPRCPN